MDDKFTLREITTNPELINPGLINEKDKHGDTLLHRAIKCGYDITNLLSKNANPNIKNKFDNTPLHDGCRFSEYIQQLIEAGANLNVQNIDGRTPLIKNLLSYSGHADASTMLLIERCSDVNIKDNNGRTALLMACLSHEPYNNLIIDKLVSAGADDVEAAFEYTHHPHLEPHTEYVKYRKYYE